MEPIPVATANINKSLRGDRLHTAVTKATAGRDLVLVQEAESDAHVHALADVHGLDAYLPDGAGRGKTVANACPILYDAARFRRLDCGSVIVGEGIAHVQPDRPANWVLLQDRATGTKVAVISAHTVSGVWRNLARRFRQWSGRTRRQESEHELARLAMLTRTLSARADVVIGGGDLNRRHKLDADVLGADRVVYAHHPTHGRSWYDLLWLVGAGASHVHRRKSPSDHDVLVATVTPASQAGDRNRHPQKENPVSNYPGADRSQWFGDTYPGSPIDPNVIVVHTTEGGGWPSYSGGAVAPNLTLWCHPKGPRLRQHIRLDRSARALENPAGGVETNTLNCIQIELIGSCDRRDGYGAVYWPDPPQWAIQQLADVLAELHRLYPAIPLQAVPLWLPYPQSYGNTRARMSGHQWRNFYGICGHQHVPENHHGDPGDIPIDKILATAGGESARTAPEEDDVTPQDIEEIAKAVWNTDIDNHKADKSPQGHMKARVFMTNLEQDQDALRAEVRELTAKIERLSKEK